jgi:GNAT superfamily N-acetyltransferase
MDGSGHKKRLRMLPPRLEPDGARRSGADMQCDDYRPRLVRAWLTARSVGRGLPAPVSDRGGFRIDTDSEDEISRWVLPKITAGLIELGPSFREPRHLSGCIASSVTKWKLLAHRHFMTAAGPLVPRRLPDGYELGLKRSGALAEARVTCHADGKLAASGFAVAAAGVFIYDRIITLAEHRRKGLGSAVVSALSGINAARLLLRSWSPRRTGANCTPGWVGGLSRHSRRPQFLP